MKIPAAFGLISLLAILPACAPKASPDEARKFTDDAEQKLLSLSIDSGRADWIKSTYITDDTEAIAAKLDRARHQCAGRLRQAGHALRWPDARPRHRAQDHAAEDFASRSPRPADPKESEELTRITAAARRHLRQRQVLPRRTSRVARISRSSPRSWRESRDPKQLLDAWTGWHTISTPHARATSRATSTLANKGARELGFKDNGAMWRAKYDMPPDDFAKELDRLWDQVSPLYLSLHAYVRTRLHEKYGDRRAGQRPHSRRTCWATCGRRIGATFIRWLRRRTPTPATI